MTFGSTPSPESLHKSKPGATLHITFNMANLKKTQKLGRGAAKQIRNMALGTLGFVPPTPPFYKEKSSNYLEASPSLE